MEPEPEAPPRRFDLLAMALFVFFVLLMVTVVALLALPTMTG